MKKLTFTSTLVLALLAFSKEIFANSPASFKRDPFIQGGCRIPQPHDLIGVNIQATIEVKKDGRTKYKLLTEKKNNNAKLILEEIIKCPITAGTRNEWSKGAIVSEKTDGSFIFNFTPVNLDSRKAFNRCFGPRYPDLAASLMRQGITEIQFKITTQTNKPEIKIQKSSGFKELDDASVEHAQNCLSYDEVKGDLEKDIWIDKKYNWKIKSEQ